VRDLVLLHVGPAFTNPQKIERNRKTPYKLSYSPIPNRDFMGKRLSLLCTLKICLNTPSLFSGNPVRGSMDSPTSDSSSKMEWFPALENVICKGKLFRIQLWRLNEMWRFMKVDLKGNWKVNRFVTKFLWKHFFNWSLTGRLKGVLDQRVQ